MSEYVHTPYVNVPGLHMFLNTLTYRKPHFHRNPELILVLDGELKANIEYSSYILDPGDIILINSGGSHELISVGNNCLFLCLQFIPDSWWAIGKNGRFDDNIPKSYFTESEYSELIKQILESAMAYFTMSPHYELFCTSITQLILYKLITKMPYRTVTDKNLSSRESMTERLMRLVDYVESNYNKKPSLSAFAESEGVSPTYMSRFVHSTINQSFQTYVTTVRFYAACQMIRKGNDNLLDICYAAGFSDYRYFSDVFKLRTGMTPAMYKKNIDKEKFKSESYDFEHIHSAEESIQILKKYM